MVKPQSKTQKKMDNNVRLALTEACEQFLDDVSGFQWLTHQTDFNNFPASLLITCVFDTDQSRQQACENGDSSKMQNVIQALLLRIGLKLKAPKQQVIFDSEECRE
jgi:hypothetical protein